MRYRCLAPLSVLAVCLGSAHADTLDTITFSFPTTSIPQPFGNPPDVVGAITRTVVVPASPTPVAEPFVVAPDTFWIDPFGNPPGAFPPPGDISFYFSSTGAGFVFTENLSNPRAFFNFQSAQLFSGTAAAPTFLIGTFPAQFSVPIFGYGYDFGTITIAPAVPTPTAVPEPGSLALLATGTLGLLSAARRRFSAA